MDPYGSVWVHMVPGDLFQGFPGPTPLKSIEKYWFGGLWVGGRGVPPLILAYLRELVELPSSWPPARVGGGVGAAVHDTASAGSAGK